MSLFRENSCNALLVEKLLISVLSIRIAKGIFLSIFFCFHSAPEMTKTLRTYIKTGKGQRECTHRECMQKVGTYRSTNTICCYVIVTQSKAQNANK